MRLDVHRADGTSGSGKCRFEISYGNLHIVDVLAADEEDAETKFIYTLITGLENKTIDFDIK